jgi:DNA-binding transcriptional ArsR family regulator
VGHLAHEGECSCGHFELGISKATLSHHFRVLREAGVVHARPDGRKRYLSLRADDLEARFPGLLEAVLGSEAPGRRNGRRAALPAAEPFGGQAATA